MRALGAERVVELGTWHGCSASHIAQALARLNVVVDVSPEELREVVEQSLLLARAAQQETAGTPLLAVGHCYGGRRSGRHWSVREIVELQSGDGTRPATVTYRVVEGKGRHRRGSCSRKEFLQGLGHELRPRQAHRQR